jgi:5,10-methylenetetrahydromethanopterin reductase
MKIGLMAGVSGIETVENLEYDAYRARREGFDTYWLAQGFGVDALTALAVVGNLVGKIDFGTSVVPSYPRHPVVLAQQALTTQSVLRGRLSLGLGLSHKPVIESMFGYSFDNPVRHMREYLDVLMPLLRAGKVDIEGETVSAKVNLDRLGVKKLPVLLAALGPKMLELAGTVADGTITWMTGPNTLESHIVAGITAAADRAGRPAPRVVVGMPVCVTNDADTARTVAAKQFRVYGVLPSYRAMLDREGASGPADVVVVGDAKSVCAHIERFAGAGGTEFAALPFGTPEEIDRTRAVVAAWE